MADRTKTMKTFKYFFESKHRAKKLPGSSRWEYRGYEIEKMPNGWMVKPPGAMGFSDVERSKKAAMELIDRYEDV